MKVIFYRFTDPRDGAEHGGITRNLDTAEEVAKEVTGLTGACWIRKAQFKHTTIIFDPNISGIMSGLHEAMKFAHDVHELIPMVRSTNGKDSSIHLKRRGINLERFSQAG